MLVFNGPTDPGGSFPLPNPERPCKGVCWWHGWELGGALLVIVEWNVQVENKSERLVLTPDMLRGKNPVGEKVLSTEALIAYVHLWFKLWSLSWSSCDCAWVRNQSVPNACVYVRQTPYMHTKDNAWLAVCGARRSLWWEMVSVVGFSSLCTCKEKITHDLENKTLPPA